MSIKDFFQKIVSVFKKEKMLPANIEGEATKDGKSKRNFVADLKKDVPTSKTIDMQQDFLDVAQEHNELAKAEELLYDKIFLAAKGVEFSDEDDIRKLKEDFIEEYKKENSHVPEGLVNIMIEETVDDYCSKAFTTFCEVKKREANGESLILSDCEKEQVAYMEQAIEIGGKISELRGTLNGMLLAGYNHSLTTPENFEAKTQKEKGMESCKKIIELFKYKAEQKGLEVEGVTDLDRLLFLTDRASDALDAWANMKIYDSYQKSLEKYNGYLDNGGTPPDLEVLKSTRISKIRWTMSNGDKERLEGEADKLIQEGRISINGNKGNNLDNYK
jgi:hypothetical protein